LHSAVIPAERGPLERLLSLFAEVRRGEAGTALLMALNIFLLLTCYYIIKPVREALILSVPGGAEIKSYASAGQVILLLFFIPAYSAFANRVNRIRLITWVTAFFIACLIGFYLLAQARLPSLGVVFFLWIGIFNMMIVAQFWSFANDIYTPEQGKRLFAIVAFGGTAGAILGAGIARALIAPVGVNQLMLVSAAILGASIVLTRIVEARTRGDAMRGRSASPAAFSSC
jgi:AAA family ATP:ADP antiporter